jgi:hypothetical protein
MFNIIEAYRPYLDINFRDENTKKLHHLLETLLESKSGLNTIIVFQLINVLFDINTDIYSLYETIGPHIEYHFGDKKCCSYRWGVEQCIDGTFIPNRCISQKLPGFLYCSKHNEKETKVCQGCIKDTKKEIVHHFGWEHWGNIFEKNLRSVFIKNISQLKVVQLTSYPLKYLKNKKHTIIKIPENMEKPKAETTTISEKTVLKHNEPKKTIIVNNIEPKKPKLLSGLISKIDICKDMSDTFKIHLLLYLIQNNLIKISNKFPVKQINIYDSDDAYFSDNKFVYKLIESKMKSVGIIKDNDTIILKESIEDIISNDIKYTDMEINSFIDSLLSKNNE